MHLLLRFLRFVRPYRTVLALTFILVAVSSALTLVSARILGHLVQNFADWMKATAKGPVKPEYTTDVLRDAFLWGSAVIGATFLRSGVGALRGVLAGFAAQKVVFDIRNKVLNHITGLSLPFFERYPSGQLMSRLTTDVDTLQLLVTSATVDFLADVLQATILGVALIVISPRLALLAIVLAPLVAVATYIYGRRMRIASRALQAQLAAVAEQILETISGIRVVMGFNAQTHEKRLFHRQNARALRLGLRRLRMQNLWMASSEGALMVGTAVLAVAGIREMIADRLHVSDVTAFTAILMYLPMPLIRLTMFNDTLQRGLAAAERVFELLDTKPAVTDAPGARDVERVAGHVRYENVSFSYDGARNVLDNITLDIREGTTVALVGPSGAGKTTLANLLVRFYDATQGRILCDGDDIRMWTLRSWRKQVGLVLQDTFLFSGTIRDNIAIGRAGASDEEIEAAAMAANAHDFIARLPQGYLTPVGERGMKLSGGERQRIAIARAILRDPPILLLDEATSSLDSEAESLIQAALDRLLEGRTALVIAHRLSTVQRADLIAVVDAGRIVEQGSHEELLRLEGLYARLYQTQFQSPPRKRAYEEPSLNEECRYLIPPDAR